MKNQRKNCSIPKVMVFSFILLGLFYLNSFATETQSSDPNAGSKYLDAVREFADNVLKYGKDTYGPKHTPLFVDGLNVNTHEPVKWLSPKGDALHATEYNAWIISNFASQQILLRTLDGLSTVTGDTQYREAAMEAIKYVFENFMASNGLIYWGNEVAYDAGADRVIAEDRSYYRPLWGFRHSPKYIVPYYELMWQVDPNATRRFIESFWSAHVLDWSNLDMDRLSQYYGTYKEPWNHEYTGDPVPFQTSFQGRHAFINVGFILAYSGAMLTKLSGDEQPLVWSERLVQRYIDTRYPNIGISAGIYNTLFNSGPSSIHRFPVNPYLSGMRNFPEESHVHSWLTVLLTGELLGEKGQQLVQWIVEEMTAWGKVAYRKEDNSFIPMLIDGTNIEGRVNPLFPRGFDKAEACPAGPQYFWGYSAAYHASGDTYIWGMIRNIAHGNQYGDIGLSSSDTPELRTETDCSDAYTLLGFISLYEKTQKQEFLEMACRIGDNILQNKFHKGFFVPSEKHIYTRFDCLESLALLHLATTLSPQTESVPTAWPSLPVFFASYRFREVGHDRLDIYTLTDSNEPPLSIHEAASIGDINLVQTMIEDGIDVDRPDFHDNKTALHRATISGRKNVVEFLLGKGADIGMKDNDGFTPLLYAVQNNNFDLVKLLLDAGADINAKNNIGRTPFDLAQQRAQLTGQTEILELIKANVEIPSIHLAAQFGNLEKVKEFLEQGTDINDKDENGQTALYIAVRNDNKEIVKLLIDEGADVNAKNEDGQTSLDIILNRPSYQISRNPNHAEIRDLLIADGAEILSIHAAVKAGDLEKVKSFVEQGLDINSKNEDGDTALHIALDRDYNDVAKLLIEKGADVNAKDKGNETPLYNAIYNSNKDLVSLLVNKGADVNFSASEGDSILYEAVWMMDFDIVKILVDNGAKYDVKDEDGSTALYEAISQGSMDMVELFISKGIDKSSIHMAACAGDLSKVKEFIDKGTAIDANDEADWTALVWAVNAGQTEVAEFLINNNANVNVKYGRQNQSLLHSAAQSGSVKLIELLIEKGINVNVKNQAQATPLFNAASSGNLQIVELLVSKGADVNAKNRMGQTPLHSACQRGNKEVAEFLIDNGSDVNVKPEGAVAALAGRTPLYIAVQSGDKEIAELLISKGADVTVEIMNLAKQRGNIEIIELLQQNAFVHNVTIKNVSAPENCIKGETVPIPITIENSGNYKESITIKVNNVTDNTEIGNETIDLLAGGEADLIFDSPVSGFQQFGNYVYHGDVNADGYDDLLITASQYNERQGRAYLYYGGVDMDSNPDMIFTGENTGDWFSEGGWISDLNNDGHPDIILGALGYNSEQGRVYIYYGGPDIDTVPDLIIDGEPNVAGGFGRTCTSGDVNGDGYEDLFVGALRYPNKQYIGRIYLYYGGNPMDTDWDLVFTGEKAEDTFGWMIDASGDVDGDKCCDLVTATRWFNYTEGDPDRGRAYLYYGGDPMDEICDIVFTGENSIDDFGSALEVADVDNDGRAEIFIGARTYNEYSGRVYAYWGKEKTSMNNQPDLIFESESTHIAFGGDDIEVGNIDNDEYGDISIAAYGYPPGERSGRTYIYYGNTQENMNVNFDDTITFSGRNNLAQFITIGDFNNDNYGDMVVGGWGYPDDARQGRVWLCYGGPSKCTGKIITWDTTNSSIGTHTLKVEVPPVDGEQNIEDNVKTITIEVTEPTE